MTNADISLHDLIPLADKGAYKLHFARWNSHTQPLDDYLQDWGIWEGWQRYRPGRNDFNLPYVFSLMSFYPEQDIWLFGGIWNVAGLSDDGYNVSLSDIAQAYIGRLKIRYRYKDRTTRPFLSKHYPNMVVSEVLREPYTGRVFPGYQNLELSFAELESIVRISRPDWKQPLELAKGIYLITDTSSGKRYVGAAYAGEGVWSRWNSYVQSGHGDNVQLRALVDSTGLDHCRANFRFALLEHHSPTVSDETIIAREVFWKNVMHSRSEFGFNSN